MKGVHNVRFEVDILISRPELLHIIEYHLIKWVPWEAPYLFQYNAAIFLLECFWPPDWVCL